VLGSAVLPKGTGPEAERACEEVICLPIHPRLRPDELDRVADAVRRGARA
jgi:dTDP-4-amino-4,6-dideoxygalactose transaminase